MGELVSALPPTWSSKQMPLVQVGGGLPVGQNWGAFGPRWRNRSTPIAWSFQQVHLQSRALQRIVFVCPCASLQRLGGLTLRSYLALALWEWALKRNIFLSAKHLSGTLNVSADWESRHFLDWSKWQLCPAMFRSLMQVRGPCAIDLFADRLNAQLPRFLISWRPDPMALATDALLQGWSGGTHSPLLPNNAIFSETERGDRYLDR
jgi:hypothetical protein